MKKKFVKVVLPTLAFGLSALVPASVAQAAQGLLTKPCSNQSYELWYLNSQLINPPRAYATTWTKNPDAACATRDTLFVRMNYLTPTGTNAWTAWTAGPGSGLAVGVQSQGTFIQSQHQACPTSSRTNCTSVYTR